MSSRGQHPYLFSHGDLILGLSLSDLGEIGCKLEVLGLTTKDLLEFLDKDKVQLFARSVSRIKELEMKLQKIQRICK